MSLPGFPTTVELFPILRIMTAPEPIMLLFPIQTNYVFSYSKSKYMNTMLPIENVIRMYDNNLMLRERNLVHSLAYFRIDIILFNYFTTFDESAKFNSPSELDIS